MSPEVPDPVTKLVLTMLIVGRKKGATEIAVHKVDGRCVVEFVIDGDRIEEMSPPPEVHAGMVRKLHVMGSIPVYRKGHHATGRFRIVFPHERAVEYELRAQGHGEDVAAVVRVLSGGDPN